MNETATKMTSEDAAEFLDNVECARCGGVRPDVLTCEDCGVRGCECVVETWRSECGRGPDGEDLCFPCAPSPCGCRDCDPDRYRDADLDR